MIPSLERKRDIWANNLVKSAAGNRWMRRIVPCFARMNMFLDFIKWQANTIGNSDAKALLALLEDATRMAERRAKDEACANGNHPWNADGYCSNCEVQREQYLRDLLNDEVVSNAERAKAREKPAQRFEPRQLELFKEKVSGGTVMSTMSLIHTPSSPFATPNDPWAKAHAKAYDWKKHEENDPFPQDPGRGWE